MPPLPLNGTHNPSPFPPACHPCRLRGAQGTWVREVRVRARVRSRFFEKRVPEQDLNPGKTFGVRVRVAVGQGREISVVSCERYRSQR